MKRRSSRLSKLLAGGLSAVALFLGISFLSLVICVQARPSGQDVSDFEKRMDKLNSQMRDIRTRLASESRKESSALSDLARIDLNRRLILKELAAQNLQMAKTNEELAGLEAEIGRHRAELEREKALIEKTLVTLYKFGRPDFLQFILQARDFETFLRESRNLSILAEYQENTILDYLETLADLREAETELEEKGAELARLITASDLKRKELESERQKTLALVRGIRRTKSSFESALAELNDSTAQLQGMMNRIASSEWLLSGPFVPLNERRGKLPWPLDGRVITSFGYQRHPRFNTILVNNGIEIAPKKDKVHALAVHPGKVAYADYMAGYGNVIIVDHGMSYYTLYGHCAEFLVEGGEMVEESQPLAVVGDSGSLNGECLYFEIRQRAKALNPLQWLKRR
jgi:septal ring factor EnvC (AmiA/AmiB activator)